MSIVTLKKKTNQQYHCMSVGRASFSLNGTHRSQGWVGQTMLSRSLPRTPHRGVTAQGHGGCCGKYSTTSVNIVSGIHDQNDPTYLKSSVLDTRGMLMTKYRWVRRPAPYTSVKPDSGLHNTDQGSYLELLRRRVTAPCPTSEAANILSVASNCCSQVQSTKRVGPLDQSEYLSSAASGCSAPAWNPTSKTPSAQIPFACHGSLEN